MDPATLVWQKRACLQIRRHCVIHRPLARYVKLRVAHAPGTLGTFSSPPTSKETASDPGMHQGTWCMSGSLAGDSGEKRSGIPGACATRNFTYLVRGPLRRHGKNHKPHSRQAGVPDLSVLWRLTSPSDYSSRPTTGAEQRWVRWLQFD